MKYIIANWKLNGSKSLLNEFLDKSTIFNSQNYVVLCPPHLFLNHLNRFGNIDNFFIGSQNVSEFNNGAFTGEISAEILADNQIFHSIVGHSERRVLLGETDEKINLKIKNLINRNIIPILCIGENLNKETQTLLNTLLIFS